MTGGSIYLHYLGETRYAAKRKEHQRPEQRPPLHLVSIRQGESLQHKGRHSGHPAALVRSRTIG